MEDFGANPVVYGVLGATCPAFQLAGAPVLGRWSDRVGGRRILLPSQPGTFLSWATFAVAYLADVSSEENRNRTFGRMSISANPGLVLGPALAGLLGASALGELPPVLAATGICSGAVFFVLSMLPESKPCAVSQSPTTPNMRKVLGYEQEDCLAADPSNKSGLGEVLQTPQVPLHLLLYFLIFLGFNIFYAAFPVHTVRRLGWPCRARGSSFRSRAGS